MRVSRFRGALAACFVASAMALSACGGETDCESAPAQGSGPATVELELQSSVTVLADDHEEDCD